jgi:signal transduction histidine kinase/ActR/RegA family two-component response regulator
MGTSLLQLLKDYPNEILNRFVSQVRGEGVAPAGLSRSLLVDHIPSFLGDLAEQLGAISLGTGLEGARPVVATTSAPARIHGLEAWQLGFDLGGLVREFGILRRSIIESARAQGVVLTLDEFDVLSTYLNVGVREAVTQYTDQRDREVAAQKSNLAFAAEAGELLSSSLDYRSTLSRLTALLVPRLADWCAVHLDGVSVEDMPIAHVDPSKVEILRDIYRRFPVTRDSPNAYAGALASGKPQLISEIDPALYETFAESDEHLSMLRALNACSWLIVPLRVQEHVFGALTLVYADSARRYTEADLTLANDLARRAAVAIDNARLYQLSQAERSRVEAATRAKDEFVAMVSHELRTPLNAILGWVRLMRAGALSEEKRDHAFEVIERNANAQNQLVGDLLDISRAITGKIRIHPSQVDLANVIDITLEDARVALEAKRIQVQLEVERGQSIMRGDGDRLQQIVWNLLSNAVKFTPKGGNIWVSLRRIESDLELVVADDGIGISAEFLPYVFESFRQSDGGAARVHGGLGVGLSITKHLVNLHGGTIEAHSAGYGSGARFSVRLPVSPLVSATLGVSQVPATKEPSLSLDLPTGLDGLRVLVVEDEPDARELIGYVLESCGIEVRLAGSVAAALTELAVFTPHVIISDIGMPDEDGYSLIRSIRTSPVADHKDIPAIALTAFARNEDRTRALVAGFNVHMSKPVEPSALVRAVVDLAGNVKRG